MVVIGYFNLDEVVLRHGEVLGADLPASHDNLQCERLATYGVHARHAQWGAILTTHAVFAVA